MLDNKPEFEIDPQNPNARSLALSYGSQKIFSAWKVWDELAAYATPIKSIHVSDRGHFGRTQIKASDVKVEALGFSIQAQMIYKVLYEGLKESRNINIIRPIADLKIDLEKSIVSFKATTGVNLSRHSSESWNPEERSQNQIKNAWIPACAGMTKELQGDLIILAEGGQSNLLDILKFDRRKKEYHQTAIVATIKLSEAHKNQAFERFTSTGPIALLPIAENKMALVWTIATNEAPTLLEKNEADFLKALQEAFGLRAGYFLETSERSSYPLKLDIPEQVLKNKSLLLGNAAHTLHPVAAQGFNLTLRDIDCLVACLKNERVDTALEKYLGDRQKNQSRTIAFTDNLIDIFSNNTFPITPLRGWGLSLLNNAGIMKNYLAKLVMGYYR